MELQHPRDHDPQLHRNLYLNWGPQELESEYGLGIMASLCRDGTGSSTNHSDPVMGTDLSGPWRPELGTGP